MLIVKKKIDDLKAASYNPRKDLKPGDKEYEKLKRSITEFGYVEPVIWNERTGTVVGGHQRLKVLKDLGYEEIDCVVVNISLEQEKALNVALNKISGEWDNALLGDLLKELELTGYDITLTGFDLKEAKDLYGKGSMENVHEDNFNPEKEVKEIKEPKTKLGDIYHLGEHRIICGDSTNVEYYKKVLDEKKIDLVVTDPPYNIDYGGTISGNGRDIANDNMSDSEFYEFLLGFYKACFEMIKEGGPIYVFHSTKETVNFINAMIDGGFKYAQTLVWYKNHFTLGRQDYQWIHEPILYGWKEGAAHYFINDRTIATVIEELRLNGKKMSKNELLEILNKITGLETSVILDNKPNKSVEHPTMKPITLCAKLIYNSSHEGDIVWDSFLGSGSTLIACEQLNRRCYGIELEPKYVDVIVKRYKEQNPNGVVKHFRNGVEIK